MASGHDIFQAMYDQFRLGSPSSEQYVVDPGSGGTFDLRSKDNAFATIASGTRKLPASVPKGVRFTVYATGSVTIQNSAGSTTATLTSGQCVEFRSRGDSTWAEVKGYNGDMTASMIPVEDTADYFAGTDIETILADIGATYRLPNAKFNTTAAASPVTPAAGILTGAGHVYYQITTDGAFSLVTRTATQLYGDLGAAAYVGLSYQLTVINRGDNTVTITAGSGITTTGELTIALTSTRTYVITFTSATAATMVAVNKGTIET